MFNEAIYQSKTSFNQGFLSNLPDDIQLDKELQSYYEYSAKYFSNHNSKDEFFNLHAGKSQTSLLRDQQQHHNSSSIKKTILMKKRGEDGYVLLSKNRPSSANFNKTQRRNFKHLSILNNQEMPAQGSDAQRQTQQASKSHNDSMRKQCRGIKPYSLKQGIVGHKMTTKSSIRQQQQTAGDSTNKSSNRPLSVYESQTSINGKIGLGDTLKQNPKKPQERIFHEYLKFQRLMDGSALKTDPYMMQTQPKTLKSPPNLNSDHLEDRNKKFNMLLNNLIKKNKMSKQSTAQTILNALTQDNSLESFQAQLQPTVLKLATKTEDMRIQQQSPLGSQIITDFDHVNSLTGNNENGSGQGLSITRTQKLRISDFIKLQASDLKVLNSQQQQKEKEKDKLEKSFNLQQTTTDSRKSRPHTGNQPDNIQSQQLYQTQYNLSNAGAIATNREEQITLGDMPKGGILEGNLIIKQKVMKQRFSRPKSANQTAGLHGIKGYSKPIVITNPPQLMKIVYDDPRHCNEQMITQAKMPQFKRYQKYKQEHYVEMEQDQKVIQQRKQQYNQQIQLDHQSIQKTNESLSPQALRMELTQRTVSLKNEFNEQKKFVNLLNTTNKLEKKNAECQNEDSIFQNRQNKTTVKNMNDSPHYSQLGPTKTAVDYESILRLKGQMFQITPKDVLIQNRRTLITANKSMAQKTSYQPNKNISNILNESGFLNKSGKSGIVSESRGRPSRHPFSNINSSNNQSPSPNNNKRLVSQDLNSNSGFDSHNATGNVSFAKIGFSVNVVKIRNNQFQQNLPKVQNKTVASKQPTHQRQKIIGLY
ncbi:UNKNOWN [Stylonychia lemnae]|uniref:Uncharacterized protein n=1 Tax=Stylonychia lemnae TaxID=5949 RepID=A0A078AYW5_STYLE|nr:UNKNOWN [Stylonychia lemnae]|eukprot:CDW87354.1 UNKNOWN [Stylonychia lemnae]